MHTLEVVLPVAGLPETESVHGGARVAKGRVAVGRAAQVQVAQLRQVGPHHLVRVDEDDLLDAASASKQVDTKEKPIKLSRNNVMKS